MAKNIIIYPSGTTSNTNPHIVFKGDAGQIQLNVIATPGDAVLQLSSSTVSSGTILDPSTGITASGFKSQLVMFKLEALVLLVLVDFGKVI